MQTKPQHITVFMPNDSKVEVTYYCTDAKLKEKEKVELTRLVIQLHDCICAIKIDKSISIKMHDLETIVHNKVINTKGHLC